MRAAKIKAFGENLEIVEVADPVADGETAVVCIEAASINPSDVKNVGGAMQQTTLPRIPGRDFAGVVEAGPVEWIGAEVWGTGGDVGFTRDGTHAQRAAFMRRGKQRPGFIAATISASAHWRDSCCFFLPEHRPA